VTAALRVLLAIGALVTVTIGGWAQFFPESFYSGFPTVDLTPPFSEHLMRDYGGATLGLAVVLAAAAIWTETRLVIIAALAYLVFAVPHAAFHFDHLDHATQGESALLVSEMVASVALPAVIIALAVVRMRRDRHLHHPPVG
jgi:hypothetical protein